jgi:tetratricopeptide (TPR) repeat protein
MTRWLIAPLLLCSTLSATAETYQPGGENDPLLRAAQFYADSGQSFAALSTAQYALSQASAVTATADLQQRVYLSAQDLNVDPLPSALIDYLNAPAATPALTVETDSDAVYRLYNHGVTLLHSGKAEQGLTALLQLVDGDYSDEDKLMLRDKTNLALGYYFLEQRRTGEAGERFREVRRLSPYATRALVGLGWALLRPDNPALSGANHPVSDPMQNSSDFLWSGSEDEIAWARRKAPFRRAWSVVKGEMVEDLRNAIVPWMELIAGDPLDPAVQEGMLIIPYAMTHMGDFQKAESYYQIAQDNLREVHDTLAANKASVSSGELVSAITANDDANETGWDDWLCRTIVAPPTAYVSLLIGNTDFLDALEQFRKLHTLEKTMRLRWQSLEVPAQQDTAIQQLRERIEGLLSRIHDSQQSWQIQLEQAALAELSERQKLVEMYIAEAGFALARIHDSPRPRVNPLPGLME